MSVGFEDELRSVRNLVRSSLLSSAVGLTLADFRRTYLDQVGQNLDFSRLGHSTLVGFLRSIPDVVKVKELANGEVLLEAVEDATTRHQAKMTRGQREGDNAYNRSTKRAIRQSSQMRQSGRSPTPANAVLPPSRVPCRHPTAAPEDEKSSESTPERFNMRRADAGQMRYSTPKALAAAKPRPCPPPPSKPLMGAISDALVPPDIVKNVVAMVNMFPDGISVYKLAGQYKEEFGHELAYRKWKFDSVSLKTTMTHDFRLFQMAEFLRTINEVSVRKAAGNDVLVCPLDLDALSLAPTAFTGRVAKLRSVVRAKSGNIPESIQKDVKEMVARNGKVFLESFNDAYTVSPRSRRTG